jgi:hypothetical protein
MRQELKFLVPPSMRAAVAAGLDGLLARHRYRGEGASDLPGGHHYTTTIYFDTPSRSLFRAGGASGSHLKLRAREYYERHPSLAEVATGPRRLIRPSPLLWLELKESDGARSHKLRVGLPKADASHFLHDRRVTPAIERIQEVTYGSEGARVLRELIRFCSTYEEPFAADCLVSYRRLAWESTDASVRATLDLGLAFYRPPDDLWSRGRPLIREALGDPAGFEPQAIVELKVFDEVPRSLVSVLEGLGATPVVYSKFLSGSRAVHG